MLRMCVVGQKEKNSLNNEKNVSFFRNILNG